MKKSGLLLTLILLSYLGNAQDSTYETLWKNVEKHEMEGLPKSALKVVNEIALLAKKDKNDPQFIKTLFFKSKFALVLEEDAQLLIINDFKNAIAESSFPTKNILENILANLYWQYYNQNRWQFYNRTKTASKIDAVDFRTWDLETLFAEIHAHYQQSLQDIEKLQLEALGKYNAILNLQKESKIYRPTLFDFLSHNALEFYKTTETNITKPAYKFEIDNPDYLKDAASFSKLEITSKDTTSLQLHALKMYQNLIQFHLKDTEPFALAAVNIERLKFVNQHATFSNKESFLLEAFETEVTYLKTHEVSGLYLYEIAAIYVEQSKQYQPKINEDARWKAKEAMALCESVISKFPSSKASEKCQSLKSQILQKTIQITTESTLPIQQHARLLVRYKNLDTLQFKIYGVSKNQLEKFNKIYREDEQLEFIKKLSTDIQWQSNLRNENDYQNHSTEILIPKLDNGNYIISASPENEAATFGFSTIQVTNLVLVESESETHKIFQIIDRNNGKPIENAKVSLTYFEDYRKKTTQEHFITNTHGEVKVKKESKRYRNIHTKVSTTNDTAYFGDYYINDYYKPPTNIAQYKGFVFTDRSIYRPGQTVYFKAIAMKTEAGKSEVLANHKVHATLYNVNGEELQKTDFITNQFGSVSGEFILPNGGLNGDYLIDFVSETTHPFTANHYFSVEEYKRPKFETKFLPVTETYKVNDLVTVKGNALAYAGSNITDAKVVYRVQRTVQYPRWYYWHRPWFNSESQEIIHGETTTNAQGVFEISFKALPDQSVDKSSLPIFNYEITADVTDINGETRSATTVVNVGYHALVAQLDITENLNKNNKDTSIHIDTKNLNGEFISATGTVKIFKLRAPNAVLRARPWTAPDYQDMSEDNFKNMFPHDAFSNEDQINNWEKGTQVFEKPFNTETSKELPLGNLKKWESGTYLITLESKDKFGQLVKDEAKITLSGGDDKTLADKQLFSITTNKPYYEIGETAIITLASAATNLYVTVSIEKEREIIKTEVIKLDNNKKSISIPVTSNDLGGFVVHYSFAAFNSFKAGVQTVSVPYPKTDLEIETSTFRDKLQPGTDETWRFKIKEPQGEKVAAELLASMYDASLDQFTPHNWSFNPILNPIYYAYNQANAKRSFGIQNFRVYNQSNTISFNQQQFDQWNWFGFYFRNRNNYETIMIRGLSTKKTSSPISKSLEFEGDSSNLDEVMVIGYAAEMTSNLTGSISEDSIKDKDSIANTTHVKPNFDTVQIRKNLQETAFFFPQLQTDSEGNISFNFTTPEALTQWKLQLLAHTKNLESGIKTLTTVTQKELMVILNVPRFLRQGDQISLSTKIANLTDKQLSGKAYLILTDAISGKDITQKLLSRPPSEALEGNFIVEAKGNTQISWQLAIPENIDAIEYKIIAKAGDYSDGESNVLPVLSNRFLVTETMPMWIRSNETKTFTLDKLKTNTSKTLKNHKLTLEITSNPAWYAVQALPYLMEYPYDCNEQTFSRFYANALAQYIANSNPRIQNVFNQWATQDALISNLEKNEELKSILIQETPWLRDAQSESEQKKRVALLFNLNKMTNELQATKRKLESNQLPNGAWPWFQGGRENRYITQHIITGFGHLKQLKVETNEADNMILKAINYLDAEFVQEYKDLTKYNAKVDLTKDHLSVTQLHYLYMRSFYPEIKKSKQVEEIIGYYQTQIQKYWLTRSLYDKGLMALVVHRMNDKPTATKILNSLKETSITTDELGMYWKENTNSWHWYQAPIETQALLIEAFSEIENDIKTIDNLKIWLLKNKQTNQWKTTKATTNAVYALLLQGSDWLSVTEAVDVLVGNQKIEPSKLENVKVEAGTGYYKTSWNTSEIKPDMATVTLTKKANGITWGGLYYQYFEDLDKITTNETPLKLSKKLFLKTNTDTGEVITQITEKTDVKVGDLVRVRIELRSDRAMEFIHMKDMRAAGLEPINVLSQYKWQDGLGYYESTKDASTNFFFDYLPKGVFVFEYDLRVNNAGNMSNGITTIQSMYAPEFSSHSEGIRLNVE